MNGKDKWYGPWTITGTNNQNLTKVIMVPNGGITRFYLAPLAVNNNPKTIGYQVCYTSTEMNSCWASSLLFCLGSRPVDTSALPYVPLPPWQVGSNGQIPPNVASEYDSVALDIASGGELHPSTERLEGEIIVNNIPEVVTVYQVPGILQSGGTFLVIDVRSDIDQVSTRESGVAHGNT
jgi:hypothetical protein